MGLEINLHNYISESIVNGPGSRAVVWVQGCSIGCPGCFNKDTWDFKNKNLVQVNDLVSKILSNPKHTGVTFSGGEPFLQAEALTEVAKAVKKEGLNVMSFSGFTFDKLSRGDIPFSLSLLNELDYLIAGPYIEELKLISSNSLVSSSNQTTHRFNPDLEFNIRSNKVEIRISPDGTKVSTGFLCNII